MNSPRRLIDITALSTSVLCAASSPKEIRKIARFSPSKRSVESGLLSTTVSTLSRRLVSACELSSLRRVFVMMNKISETAIRRRTSLYCFVLNIIYQYEIKSVVALMA
mmetsp:Transcript_31296/g.64239  ORF Transcript_31296/g.64239 Transcript_31296/m.64239 type:complete len:108 (+) Transcript_31296:1189-1512(+)